MNQYLLKNMILSNVLFFLMLPSSLLGNCCLTYIDPSNAVNEIPNAYFPQPNIEIPTLQRTHSVEWITINDVIYLVNGITHATSGNTLGNTPLRLYSFNQITQQFTVSANGISGFNRQPETYVNQTSFLSFEGEYYIATAQVLIPPTTGNASELYRWNVYTNMFEYVINAYSVVHGNTLNATAWHVINGTAYLAVGGEASLGITARLYRFNPNNITEPYDANFPLTQVSSGTAGFSNQITGSVRTLAWLEINNTTYLVAGGIQVGVGAQRLRLYRFNQYTEELEQVSSGSAGFSVQPTTSQVNDVSWLHFNGEDYLALAQNAGGIPALRFYRFDSLLEQFVEITGVFDTQPGNSMQALEWLVVDGCAPYLCATGNANVLSPRNTFLYQFHPETLTFSSLNFFSQPQTAIEFTLSFNTIQNVIYLALGGTNDSSYGNEVNRLYTVNLIPNPYSSCFADLRITKTVSNATPREGDLISFTVTVTNNGPDNVNNVTVQDTIPSGLTFISSIASQGSYNSGTGLWDIGTVIANSSQTLTLFVTVDSGTAGTSITNTATVSESDAYVSDPYSNNSASVTITVENFVTSGSFLFWTIEGFTTTGTFNVS